jgi:hypothetical protein
MSVLVPDQQQALNDYLSIGNRATPGWLWQSAAYITSVLGMNQLQIGVTGDVGEIGVWQGRYLTLLGLLGQPTEAVVGIDSFVHSPDPARFEKQIRDRFQANPYLSSRLKLIKSDSTKLVPNDVSKVGGPFRLFSVDGGHLADEVYSDINLVCDLLVDRGVMILDDILNPTCPGVFEGTLRFLNTEKGKDFAAFCYAGNKLFVARKDSAAYWKQYLLDFMEKNKSVSIFRDTLQTISNFPVGVFPRICNSDVIVVTWSGDYLISDEGQPVLLRLKVCEPSDLDRPECILPNVNSLVN